MTYFNPIPAGVLPAGQVQQHLTADAARLRRQRQAARDGVVAEQDRYTHVVDGAEPVTPAGDEAERDGRSPQKRKPAARDEADEAAAGEDAEAGDDLPHLDVTG